jgi:hypothetical protein
MSGLSKPKVYTNEFGAHRVVMYKDNGNIEECLAQGRNGTMYCRGVELWISGWSKERIRLTPINSKDMLGNCFIDIAVDDVDKIIETLQELKEVLK